MITAVPCFPNGERVVLEWFCFWILSTILQVIPSIIQQCCCFIKGDVPLFDEFFTDKSVRKTALTVGPRCRFIDRKDMADHSHGTLCPVVLRLLVHFILDDSLDKAMDGECLGGGIAADER